MRTSSSEVDAPKAAPAECLRLDVSALSEFDLPIFRFDARGLCTYANTAAGSLVGRTPATGLTLRTLFPDPDDYSEVLRQQLKRKTGQASRYRVKFARVDTSERVPISIFAFPEAGESGGSIAIVRDIREDEVARKMHEAIELEHTDQSLLTAVAEQARRLIPFDEFRVVAVGRGRRNLRRLFSTDRDSDKVYPFKWWPMPEFLQKSFDGETSRVIDLDEMFRQPDYARMAEEDEATKRYRESGVRYSLSIPVVWGRRIVAFVGIDTRASLPYTQEQLALCTRLPLAEAVKMALYHQEVTRLRSTLKLVRQLGAHASDTQKVAQTLVEKLARSFGWDHVAVFQFDEDREGFRLLSQASATDKLLKEDYFIPENAGLVGQAFRDQVEINADLSLEGDRKVYVQGIEDMKSELALPVPGEQKRWVLNVESRYKTAFAEEDVKTLRMLVVEAGHILERAALIEMRAAILSSTSDAIIETNRRGKIRQCNRAAERMFGVARETLVGRELESFIADPDVKRSLASTEVFASRQVQVDRDQGGSLPVLLSGALLPQDVGGRVFIASDLTYELEAQRITTLKSVFRNASLESRIPLALAACWLAELAERDPTSADVVDRVLKQLRKADLPLERLMRLATTDAADPARAEPVDLCAVVSDVLSQLPSIELNAVTFDKPARADVAAPPASIRFPLESALSFALRTKPQDKLLNVSIDSSTAGSVLRVVGDWLPQVEAEEEITSVRKRWRQETANDLALARGVIDEMVTRAGGTFTCTLERPLTFEISLPSAWKE